MMRALHLLVAALLASAHPLAWAVDDTAATPVEQWGIFEIALSGPSTGNPFTEVRLAAKFTDGAQTFEVDGFYDGEGVYRVRFMPNRAGPWRYVTQSNRRALTDKRGAFSVTPAKPGNHGPVRVHNTFHFAYADGTPYRPVGTTSYSWTHRPAAQEELTLKSLAASPFNKLRMLVFPQAHGIAFMPPERWPFVGQPPRGWDFTRFNPDFFRHLEQRVGQLRDRGIEADLILHHPYDDDQDWGFDQMDRETDDRYARYLVARLAAYRNVWWSMANEFDFIRTKTETDWDHTFQVVQGSDPYGHLRSIHNGKRLYNHNQPWVTHVSMQNAMAASEPGRATLYRDVYRKPIVYDEVKYEGQHTLRWAQLSGPELAQHFWACTVAGTYAGHGEYLPDAKGAVWLAEGGTLRGESVPRIAFLRQVLQDGPAQGLDPIDLWQDPRIVGQPGQYDLVYFGLETPSAWKPRLFNAGLREGMHFVAEVIDTWAMTVTPVDDVLVLKRQDRYYFSDQGDRTIPLPGRPYMAIRLRRADSPTTPNPHPSTRN